MEAKIEVSTPKKKDYFIDVFIFRFLNILLVIHFRTKGKTMETIYDINQKMETWRKGANPEVDNWPLMDGPGNVISILVSYLLFVLIIGPAVMRNRKPFELRKVLVAYNSIQVAFSVILVWMALQVDFPRYIFSLQTCSKPSTPQTMKSDQWITKVAWWYHVSKITELLDTVFFVLRKRDRQISFLHVYHHSIVLFFTWCFLKYAPGDHGSIIILLNSFIHIIMYTYYALAAMGPAYQKYIWWKRYISILQVTQFIIIILYQCLVIFLNCGNTQAMSYIMIFNCTVFALLFSDFYVKSFTGRKNE